VWHQKDYGPWFGMKGNLGINFAPLMNAANNGFCQVGRTFEIPCDKKGNSVLTGEDQNFTCVEIEVFKMKMYK
jgi:hypothetical protein